MTNRVLSAILINRMFQANNLLLILGLQLLTLEDYSQVFNLIVMEPSEAIHLMLITALKDFL
jgi:hypothetical protein